MASVRYHRYNTRSAAKKLLKCFCGCSELTVEEVKNFSRLNVSELIRNQKSNDIFKKYLETSQQGSGKAQEALARHEKCDELLSQLSDTDVDSESFEQLYELGLQYKYERELQRATRRGDTSKIKQILLEVQDDSRNEIESSSEYKNFKNALNAKLENRT